jgi:exonuclease III
MNIHGVMIIVPKSLGKISKINIIDPHRLISCVLKIMCQGEEIDLHITNIYAPSTGSIDKVNFWKTVISKIKKYTYHIVAGDMNIITDQMDSLSRVSSILCEKSIFEDFTCIRNDGKTASRLDKILVTEMLLPIVTESRYNPAPKISDHISIKYKYTRIYHIQTQGFES